MYGVGEKYSGKWSCAGDFKLDENIVLSALPNEKDDEDAPCKSADIELAGAEVVVVDADSLKPLVTKYKYGKGYVYLLNTYAYAGHNHLQKLAAALVKKFAAVNLPDCYLKTDSQEIFWNTRRITENAYSISLLNTDWTGQNSEISAEICCPDGISAKVSVKERQVLTAVFADGKLFIPSSPEVYIAVNGKKVTAHGTNKHLLKVISANGKIEFIELDFSDSPQKEIFYK